MVKVKATQRSEKTLPNEWTNAGKRMRLKQRKRRADAVRAMKHQNLHKDK